MQIVIDKKDTGKDERINEELWKFLESTGHKVPGFKELAKGNMV
jgi:hypothetical protein